MRIDPAVGKLLPISFIEEEMRLHPDVELSSVGTNRFLSLVFETRRGYEIWAGYSPESKTITFDPSVRPETICHRVNEKFPELRLRGDEAWIFVFYHELSHVLQGGGSEWAADRYAMKRILELRKKKEDEYKELVSLVQAAVTRGIRESLKT
jgi:hypothetical protein